MSIDVQSALIGAFVLIAVVVETVLRRRRRRTDVLFILFALNLVLWFAAAFATGVRDESGLLLRVQIALAALIPASLQKLFSDLVRSGVRSTTRILTAVYPVSGLLAVTAMSPLGDLIIVKAVIAAHVGLATTIISRGIVKSSQFLPGTVQYARLRYLAIGAVATTTLVILGRLPFFGENWVALSHLAVMVYVFFLSQATSRDRLLDLHEFIARIVVLSVLAILFAAISAMFNMIGSDTTSLRLFNTVISVIIILTIYEPLKVNLEAKAIEIFFRERYDISQLLETLRRRMLRVLDPADMSRLVLDTLYDTRRATHVAIYLLEPLGRGFALESFRGPEPAPRVDERELPGLWHAVQRSRGPLLAEQLIRADEEGKDRSNRDLVDAMRKVSGDMLLPFISGDRVLGFLAIRDDRVVEPYSTQEIALLMNIVEAAVTVIENSQLAARLRERDRLAAIGEMAAGLAHEIRNPLGAIKGAAECLDPNEVDKEEEEELLQIIIEEANRLNGVVSQFLDYARPFRARFAETDVNLLMEKIARLIDVGQEEKRVRLELQLDAELPLVDLDPEQIKQVILNLVLNGIDASGEREPHVVISTRLIAGRDRVELSVRDHGGGIPRETLDHIFIPFFTTKQHGTGLGLAVCQRIVNNHGGYISVQSELGRGTEFTIRLPLHQRGRDGSTTGSFAAPGRAPQSA